MILLNLKKKISKIDKNFVELGHFENRSMKHFWIGIFEIINIEIINIFCFPKIFGNRETKNVNNLKVNNFYFRLKFSFKLQIYVSLRLMNIFQNFGTW